MLKSDSRVQYYLMQAMILAAGRGRRMYPLSEQLPKPLLPIAGKPLIEHLILSLVTAGIKKLVINLCYLGDKIEAYLGDGRRFGAQIIYSRETELLDTGGGIVNALPMLGADPFLVVSADIVTHFPFQSLPTQTTGTAHLVMVENPHYHVAGDFALGENGKLQLAGTKKYTYANIGIFDPIFFSQAPTGKFALVELLNIAIDQQQVSGELYLGRWSNVGTPEDLAVLEAHW